MHSRQLTKYYLMKTILHYLVAILFLLVTETAYALSDRWLTPPVAGTISGPSDVCVGSTGEFTIEGSSALGGYTWTLPSGMTITSGAGSKTITISFTGAGMGKYLAVSGNGLNASRYVNVYPPISGSGSVTGPSTVCPGQTGVEYNLTGVGNVTGYSWFATDAQTGGLNLSSETVDYPSGYAGGTVGVTALAGPCTPKTFTKAITASGSLPATPGQIIGAQSVLPGATGVPYSVGAIANASPTGYQWVLPPQASIASGAGTKDITVNFASSFNGGSFVVRGSNGICTGEYSPPLIVTSANLPAAAGPVSGSGGVCLAGSDVYVTYSVDPIANADSYDWTYGPGVIPMGDPNAGGYPHNRVMQIKFPANITYTTVPISVKGVNEHGEGPSSTPLNVQMYKAVGAAGPIEGPTIVCPNQTNIIYRVSEITNASPYIWNFPSGMDPISGITSNEVTVNIGPSFAGGNLRVHGLNGPCPAGPSSPLLPVAIRQMPVGAGQITGNIQVCPGQTDVAYAIPLIDNAIDYVWILPEGASISAGENTNSIIVDFALNAASGDITVYGSNCRGNGFSSKLHVSVDPVPGSAGTITGNTVVCPGETGVVYNVSPISNASGYNWTVPTGATIVSGQNTTSITVDFLSTSYTGVVKVRGTNCGIQGAESSLTINYAGKAGAPNADHSVDLVTGTLNASVPIFAVQHGDLSVPIVIRYTATGVKVTDDDGWLGHNWRISCQSYGIFREMRGLPDDYLITGSPGDPDPDNRKGWRNGTLKTSIKNFIPATDNNPSTCTDEVANHTFLNGISYNDDTEPDAFHVSLPNLSFDFYFDENNVAQVVPYTDVIITANPASGPISSFAIKDPNGVEYQFNETESISEKMFETSQYYFVRKSNQHVRELNYNTSWRLTKIVSPTYGTIDFTYETIETEDDNLIPSIDYRSFRGLFLLELKHKYQFPLITSNTAGAAGTMRYYRSSVMKSLSGIISPVMEAEFVSVEKYPGSAMKRLQAINLFDKREGSMKLVKVADLSYSEYGQQNRAFLTNLKLKIDCIETNYGFQYNFFPSLPSYSSIDKDEWDLYKIKNFNVGDPQYDETAASGSLRKIIHPLKGYTAFFYEVHDFWDGNSTVQGGGIRIKKIINYDGVSSSNDYIQEFIYKGENANSSGKLQHKNYLSFSVVRHPFGQPESYAYRYHEKQLQYPGVSDSFIADMFKVTGDQDLTHSNYLNGSAVAYERVTVKTKNAGYRVFEYELPASYGETTANDNAWAASKVLIARPSTGSSICFEKPNIEEGYNRYPFPVNPPYNFARGLLKKETDFNENGIKVRDVVYDYQRVFGGSEIKKIFGLALEELPTYFYNGSGYVDNKMFLYSKYELYTDVKTELRETIETVYNSEDLTKNSQVRSNYYFDSPNHRFLYRTVTLNSDGSESVSRIKYVKDFNISGPSSTESVALKSLYDAHRTALPVESTYSKIINGFERTLRANLTLFQTLSGKAYPYKQYTFTSNDGNDGFVASSVTGGTFIFSEKYLLHRIFSDFDDYGNATTVIEHNREVNSVAYGFDGTLPVISMTSAGIDEFKYSDFETATSVDFSPVWGSPTFSVGMNSEKALNIPAGSDGVNMLTNGLTYRRSPWYTFSCWLKASTAGTLTVLVGSGPTSSFSYQFTGTSEWQYCRIRIPVSSIIGSSSSFYVKIWSSSNAQLDDMAFYPEQASYVAYNYKIPIGKTAEKNSRGNYIYYDYDPWGRLRAIFDRDENVVKKYDYNVKP